jgi:hypothetical protein
MKTTTVSDTKVSFNALQNVMYPAERTFNLARQNKAAVIKAPKGSSALFPMDRSPC